MRCEVRTRLAAAVVAGALVCAGSALADREQVIPTAAGQKAARAAVIRRTDLVEGRRWAGSSKRPTLGWGTSCPGFQPRQSDLVVVGAAETVWKRGGVEHDSEAQVLKTRRMLTLDW